MSTTAENKQQHPPEWVERAIFVLAFVGAVWWVCEVAARMFVPWN